jgi:hypothetical protein
MPGLFERPVGKMYKERVLTEEEAKKMEKPLTAKEIGEELKPPEPEVKKADEQKKHISNR